MVVFHCRAMEGHVTLSTTRPQAKIARGDIGSLILRKITITATRCLLRDGNPLHRAWVALAEDFLLLPRLVTTVMEVVEHQDIPSLLGMAHRLDMARRLQDMEAMIIGEEVEAMGMGMDTAPAALDSRRWNRDGYVYQARLGAIGTFPTGTTLTKLYIYCKTIVHIKKQVR